MADTLAESARSNSLDVNPAEISDTLNGATALAQLEVAEPELDDVAVNQARQQSLHHLRGTLQDLRAELALLADRMLASTSPDEAEGVNIVSQPEWSIWAEACRSKRN